MNRSVFFALFTILILALVSACGGDDDSPNPPLSDGQIQAGDGDPNLPLCRLIPETIQALYEPPVPNYGARVLVVGEDSSVNYEFPVTITATVFSKSTGEVIGTESVQGDEFGQFHFTIYYLYETPEEKIRVSVSSEHCRTNTIEVALEFYPN
ncbi:hypothetical protein KJ885_05860 [Patescibacteria group bacterium]|nr:hypothetical protein [Patescibacteria group bacterium]